MTMKLGLRLGCILLCGQIATLPAAAETQVSKDILAKIESAIGSLKTSCEADLKAYCSSVTPGEGRLAFCVVAHEDKISAKCLQALFDIGNRIDLAASNILRAAKVCEGDISKNCGSIEPGEGRIAQCLIDKKANLTLACKSEVEGFQGRLQR